MRRRTCLQVLLALALSIAPALVLSAEPALATGHQYAGSSAALGVCADDAEKIGVIYGDDSNEAILWYSHQCTAVWAWYGMPRDEFNQQISIYTIPEYGGVETTAVDMPADTAVPDGYTTPLVEWNNSVKLCIEYYYGDSPCTGWH